MTTTAYDDQFVPQVTQADPDDIVTMAKELAADPSNTLYDNMVLSILCATIIDLRADLAKARAAALSELAAADAVLLDLPARRVEDWTQNFTRGDSDGDDGA